MQQPIMQHAQASSLLKRLNTTIPEVMVQNSDQGCAAGDVTIANLHSNDKADTLMAAI